MCGVAAASRTVYSRVRIDFGGRTVVMAWHIEALILSSPMVYIHRCERIGRARINRYCTGETRDFSESQAYLIRSHMPSIELDVFNSVRSIVRKDS